MDNRVITGSIATLVLLSVALSGAKAGNFTVGDQSGWTVPNPGLNYTIWAQNITAHVGDSLYFKYLPNEHNVLKVNSSAFASCNTTRAAGTLQTWDNGDTTVMLEEEGTQYFICGAPGHCLLGQAFALDVNPAPANVTPSGPGILSPPHGSATTFTSVVHYWLVTLVSLVFLYF